MTFWSGHVRATSRIPVASQRSGCAASPAPRTPTARPRFAKTATGNEPSERGRPAWRPARSRRPSRPATFRRSGETPDRCGRDVRAPRATTIPSVLDVLLRGVSARLVRDVSITFPASTHTAVAGPPACGASTLLQVIAGALKAESGEIVIGARVVNRLAGSRRRLLHVTGATDVPRRWSVGHAL